MSIDLKRTLRERGLAQKEIAATLGVSEAAVSVWGAALRAGNHQRVPAERARALADLLGVDPHVIRPDLWRCPEAAE